MRAGTCSSPIVNVGQILRAELDWASPPDDPDYSIAKTARRMGQLLPPRLLAAWRHGSHRRPDIVGAVTA